MPGCEGLTPEIFICLWDQLGNIVLRAINFALKES